MQMKFNNTEIWRICAFRELIPTQKNLGLLFSSAVVLTQPHLPPPHSELIVKEGHGGHEHVVEAETQKCMRQDHVVEAMRHKHLVEAMRHNHKGI